MMADRRREQRIAEVFVELATGEGDETTLVTMLADRCVELLDVATAQVVFVDATGRSASSGPPPSSGTATRALPMRARGQVVGALFLYGAGVDEFDPPRLRIGQALADAAGSAIATRRELRQSELRADQLQRALSGQVTIEQAKGVLAERWHIDLGQAFELLREHARRHNRRLAEVARDVIDGNAMPPIHQPVRVEETSRKH
jgi:GAF domain-containing protein